MKLSNEQSLAVKHIEGPALTLAVPGAGKTTMLLYRTINLIQSGIDSDRICTITFSKAASLDMMRRFESLFPDFNRNLKFSTIHAFCYRIILEYSRLRGVEYRLIEDGSKSKYDLIRKIYQSIFKKSISEDTLENIISKISYYKNTLTDPHVEKSGIKNFVEIFDAYESYKAKNNLIDFDDMMILSLKILDNDEYLNKKFRQNSDFYQLDEGQDTSIAQFEVIKRISSPKNNLFIVADDDQSIYGFRGATPNYLLNLKDVYPNLSLYRLQNNYRSSQNIVEVSNKFIKKNKFRYAKEIRTENEFDEPVNIIKLKNNEQEYEFILDSIKKESMNSAILYRNNISSLGLVEFLERNGVEFNIQGSRLNFFNHFVVKDILSIVEFSYDQTDAEAFSKFYYKIKGYISKKHIEFIKRTAGRNVFRTLLSYPGLPPYYKDNIFELMADFKNMKSMTIKDQIEYVLYNLGYDAYLRDFSEKFGFSYESLNEFSQMLVFIAKSENTLESLVGRLKHLEYLINSPKNSNANVNLSTIHSAKGLEYDRVFMIDLVEDVIPSSSATNINDIEEERRLFYVAMTRARSKLYLLVPKYNFDNPAVQSRFVTEVSEIEKISN